MSDVVIETEQPADQAAVATVIGRAFGDEPEVVGMVSAIRDSERYRPGLAFVARADDQVVGFVMCSGADVVDDKGIRREVLSLTPLGVLPEYERRGIGSALVNAVVAAADESGETLILLEGSPDFYGRLGFRLAADYGVDIDLPDWAPPEAAQILPLSAYDPKVRGAVDYPPAISALSD